MTRSRTGSPGRLARAVVRSAVRTLPGGELRERYREEFLAELHGMPPSHRARHVVGLLVSVPGLSRIVRRHRSQTWDELYGVIPRRPLLCTLRVGHRWGTVEAEDGTGYEGCLRCGRTVPTRHSDGQALTWAGGVGPWGSNGNAV